MVMSVYIAEMTPKESRGLLGAIIGPAFNMGSCLGLLANIGFAEFDLGWRLSIAVAGLVGLVYAIGMSFMPHTPWCIN